MMIQEDKEALKREEEELGLKNFFNIKIGNQVTVETKHMGDVEFVQIERIERDKKYITKTNPEGIIFVGCVLSPDFSEKKTFFKKKMTTVTEKNFLSIFHEREVRWLTFYTPQLEGVFFNPNTCYRDIFEFYTSEESALMGAERALEKIKNTPEKYVELFNGKKVPADDRDSKPTTQEIQVEVPYELRGLTDDELYKRLFCVYQHLDGYAVTIDKNACWFYFSETVALENMHKKVANSATEGTKVIEQTDGTLVEFPWNTKVWYKVEPIEFRDKEKEVEQER